MGIDLKLGRFCDECGRLIAKAHRIHRDKDYCSSCYPRIFIPASCSQCGAGVRVHKRSDETPICRACIASTRHCARCGKPAPKAGKIVNGQAICPSCAPYYNEKQLCSCCGKLSFRVTRMPGLGINDLVCDSCRNKVTHRTCGVCHKYRPVVGELENGKSYCASCVPGAEIIHSCPSCGGVVAGSGLSKCRSCNNLMRIKQETALHGSGLSHHWSKSLLTAFGLWLHEKQGNSPGCIKKLISHEPFFERLDATFVLAGEISEATLLEAFGPAFLRKHLLASEFLQEALKLPLSVEAKAQQGERDCIDLKLTSNSKEPFGSLLKQYAQFLTEEGLPERTIRLYLRAAEKFCGFVKLHPEKAWDESEMHHFLSHHSGSRASLYRFVTYCRSKLAWKVSMPVKAEGNQLTAKSHETVMFKELMQQINDAGPDTIGFEILEKTIAKGFGYSLNQFRRNTWQLAVNGDHLNLISDAETLTVPAGMVQIVDAWKRRIN